MFFDLEQFGSAVAVELDDGTKVSYAELAGKADAFAGRLPVPRSLVFLKTANRLNSLAAYLGCLRHGHVPLLLPGNMDHQTFNLLLDRYCPNAVFAEDAGLSVLRTVPVSMAPELALLLSTSGSTGSPRLVRLSRKNLQANTDSIIEYLHLGPDERAITVLPMHYTYGLSIVHTHLAVGAALLLTDRTVIQREFWDFLQKRGGTSLAGVPYTYMLYRRAGLFSQMELPELRYLTQAGGHLNAEDVEFVARWAKSKGVRFYVMYGQTEATARMSYLPPEKVLEKSGSVGIAVPGGRFAVEDEQHREHPGPGFRGELIYYGENVSLGYAEKPEDLALPDRNCGRLATGDVAHFDADGFCYIDGRLKRFLKITGNRIGLDEVEQVLKLHGFEAVCGGRDDLLCIACTGDCDPAALLRLMGEEFHIHPGMLKIFSVAAFPRNAAGKVLTQELFAEVLREGGK